MRFQTVGARHAARAAIVVLAAGAATLGGVSSAAYAAWPTPRAGTTPTASPARSALLDAALFGRSGKLRARLVSERRLLPLRYLTELFGDSAVRRPGVYAVPDSAAPRPLSFITLLPFAEKRGARIGNYRIGFWPAERRSARSAAYENPDGFILVTPDNQDTPLSEHFRLRDFLTKDQASVWPKYLVVREELVDKLELMVDDLNARGVRVEHVSVMSGFRTPQYNDRGVGAGGRVQDSRHQYGDAADVFVDNDRDGRMDDLNGDRRVDHRDAQVLIDAAERVEMAHPDLVGGAGRYRANSAHGPFAHIDVRGTRARWGNA